MFKKVTLSPKLVVKGKPEEVVRRALDMALKYSTICSRSSPKSVSARLS